VGKDKGGAKQGLWVRNCCLQGHRVDLLLDSSAVMVDLN